MAIAPHLPNFIATVSENTEEQIKNYIKSQKEK
jgi:REP element-mobilizing transposase RayT